MGYGSNLEGQLVIGDDNVSDFLPPIIDGSRRAMGLVPRDYDQFPQGFYASAPAWSLDDMPLIPWEEMPERIRDMEATKSRISDIYARGNKGQRIPSLDQNGQGYCVTQDSEYLTNDGWVSVIDYDGSSPVATICPLTNRIQFQYPSIVHRYEYSGEMIYSTNRRVDFGVTPNHRMYVRKWDEAKRTLSSDYSFVLAKDIGWYAGLLPAPTPQIGTHIEELAVPGFASFQGDDFFALLGLIVSDGFAGGARKNQNVVSFASFRNDPSITELAIRCGFRNKESNPNVWLITSHEFANWIRENCYCSSELGAQNKKVPQIVKVATPRQIAIFLKYFDDRNRAGSQFYSGSKRLIDDIQELHLRIGKRSTISVRDPRSSNFAGNKEGKIHSRLPQYCLTVGEADRLCIERKKHIEQDKYQGEVFCVTVPNGTVVTRRNGSVLYSGNCWAYSTVACVQMIRAISNMPYVELSPHSVAAKIKNWRDEGAWGALSLDFIKENGVMPANLWPQKSMSRSHDTPANWEVAKAFRVVEGWLDLKPAVYDRDMSAQQVATALLSRIPVIGDYNHWGHSVAVMDLVDVYPNRRATDPMRFGVLIQNSWTDRWGKLGQGILKDSKWVPNGGAAPRVVVGS